MQHQIEKIDNLLKKREESFPKRDRAYYNLEQELNNYINSLIKNTDFENWKPEQDKLTKIKKFIENPIFICGTMKSGTSLFVNLLDGHKNLMTLPGDSFFMIHNKRFKKQTFEKMAHHWTCRLINPTGQAPFWFLKKDEKSYKKFLQYLNYFFSEKKQDSITSIVSSIYASNPSAPADPKYFIEKTPDNEHYTKEILDKFPNARFIHILRNPLNNFASLKKLFSFRGNHHKFFPRNTAYYIKSGHSKAKKNQVELGKERYLILNYEDILDDCSSEMKKITNFLSIEFEENLCIPTTNKIPAKANSMYKSERVSGKLKKDNPGKWKEVLTENEKKILISHLYTHIKQTHNWDDEETKKYYSRLSDLSGKIISPLFWTAFYIKRKFGL